MKKNPLFILCSLILLVLGCSQKIVEFDISREKNGIYALNLNGQTRLFKTKIVKNWWGSSLKRFSNQFRLENF